MDVFFDRKKYIYITFKIKLLLKTEEQYRRGKRKDTTILQIYLSLSHPIKRKKNREIIELIY